MEQSSMHDLGVALMHVFKDNFSSEVHYSLGIFIAVGWI